MAGTDTLPEAADASTLGISEDALKNIQDAHDSINWDAEAEATDDEPVAEEPTAPADDDTTPTESQPSAQPTDDEPQQAEDTLNPLQKLAIKHFGLDEEDIMRLGPKAGPKFADDLIEKRNKETTFYGTVGSQLVQARAKLAPPGQQPAPTQPAPQTPQPVESADDGVSDEDIQQAFGLPGASDVADQFGDEAIEAFHKPMMKMGRMLMQTMGQEPQAPAQETNGVAHVQPQQSVTPNGQIDRGALLTTINAFFDQMSGAGFSEQYGAGNEGWQNPQHKLMREQVLQKATELTTHAQRLGGNIDPNDALNRAHFLIMQPLLVKQAEQRGRQAGIEEQSRRNNATMNPPGRTRRPGPPPKSKDQQVLEAVTAKFEQLGLDQLGDPDDEI